MHHWNDYGDHHSRWIQWTVGLPLGILFWLLVVWGIIALVRTASGRESSTPHARMNPRGAQSTDAAKSILAERFARGEVDEDEFRRRSDALRSM